MKYCVIHVKFKIPTVISTHRGIIKIILNIGFVHKLCQMEGRIYISKYFLMKRRGRIQIQVFNGPMDVIDERSQYEFYLFKQNIIDSKLLT